MSSPAKRRLPGTSASGRRPEESYLLEQHDKSPDEARDTKVLEGYREKQTHARRCEVEEDECEHELPVGRR
jgi:hypothetical protein